MHPGCLRDECPSRNTNKAVVSSKPFLAVCLTCLKNASSTGPSIDPYSVTMIQPSSGNHPSAIVEWWVTLGVCGASRSGVASATGICGFLRETGTAYGGDSLKRPDESQEASGVDSGTGRATTSKAVSALAVSIGDQALWDFTVRR